MSTALTIIGSFIIGLLIITIFVTLVKIIGNMFAVIFALVLSWILIPQEGRAQFFADMCNNMFNKKDPK